MKRLLIVLVCLGGASIASAQTPEAEKKAEEAFVKGDTAYNLGRYDEAVGWFEKAYEAWPQPEFLYNIAQSYRLAGNCKKALHFYKRFRSLKEKDTENPLSAKRKGDVDKFITDLEECAAKADENAGATPDTIEKPGGGGTTTGGDTTTTSGGDSSTTTTTGGGTDVADTTEPDPEPEVEPVDTSSPGMFTTMRKISVGVGAVGIISITTSVVFGLKAKDLQGQADEICPNAACPDPEGVRLNDDAKSAAMKSNIFLGVGIAAVAGAAVLWFVGGPDDAADAEESEEYSFTPVFSADQVGLSFAGRF